MSYVKTPETVEAVASKFGETLREWLTKTEMKLVVKRNAEEDDPRICHSHDFCDANMAMFEAVKAVMGPDAFPQEGDPDGEVVMQVWNEAWAEAKKNSFLSKN